MSSAVELLFSVTVRVSLLVLLAWGAAFLLRQRSAGIRHLVWTSAAVGALVLLAAAPFAPTVQTTRLPVWQKCSVQISPVHIELPSCADEATAKGTPGTGVGTAAFRRPSGATGTGGEDAVESSLGFIPDLVPPGDLALSTVLVGIWAGGALIVLLTILLERLWIRRLRGTSRKAGEQKLVAEARELARGFGLSEPVEIHLTRDDVSPLSWGFWSPRILLPDQAIDWSEDQRRAVLLHELGHARRRDVFTQTLAAVSCAVFWFNPLVWLAAARMRDERERACDDLVLQSGVGPASYAQCLLDLARRLSPSSAGSRIAVVGMSRGPELVERVNRLVSRRAPRQPPGRNTTFVSVLGALAVIGILAPHVIAQPDCQREDGTSRVTRTQTETAQHDAPAPQIGERIPEVGGSEQLAPA